MEEDGKPGRVKSPETELAMMKKTCILVSVARGPHISEDALIDALNNPDQGPVRAGLDVTETEPVIKQGMIDLMKEGPPL